MPGSTLRKLLQPVPLSDDDEQAGDHREEPRQPSPANRPPPRLRGTVAKEGEPDAVPAVAQPAVNDDVVDGDKLVLDDDDLGIDGSRGSEKRGSINWDLEYKDAISRQEARRQVAPPPPVGLRLTPMPPLKPPPPSVREATANHSETLERADPTKTSSSAHPPSCSATSPVVVPPRRTMQFEQQHVPSGGDVARIAEAARQEASRWQYATHAAIRGSRAQWWW